MTNRVPIPSPRIPPIQTLPTTHMKPFSCSRLYLIFCCFFYFFIIVSQAKVCLLSLNNIFIHSYTGTAPTWFACNSCPLFLCRASIWAVESLQVLNICSRKDMMLADCCLGPDDQFFSFLPIIHFFKLTMLANMPYNAFKMYLQFSFIAPQISCNQYNYINCI